MKNKWTVQIHGKANRTPFEISVINREKIFNAQEYYGWINENKLLISHNGGPCRDSLTPLVWNKMVELAHEVADKMNDCEE